MGLEKEWLGQVIPGVVITVLGAIALWFLGVPKKIIQWIRSKIRKAKAKRMALKIKEQAEVEARKRHCSNELVERDMRKQARARTGIDIGEMHPDLDPEPPDGPGDFE